MTSRKKIRLGDLLVQHDVISEAQLSAALKEQKTSGRRLGRLLIDRGAISEEGLLQFLSRQLSIPYVDLKHYDFDPETVRLIPEIHARRFRALALDARGPEVLVGMADPTDLYAFDELGRILKRPIAAAVISESELLRTFDAVYRRTEEISSFASELHQELVDGDIDLSDLVEGADVADAPVVKLLHSLFEDAVQVKASDIHIEPDETVLRIRQRIDGVLQEHEMEERRIAQALVLRLKLMAGLDIAEKRLPQDGRFSLRVKEKSIDVRISTMPVQHGESVVMRLLDQSGGLLALEQLGMPEVVRVPFEQIINRPHGMVLVTGPTGSGKTTTLYAALNRLNRAESKIITVEDPVEYRLPRINQVQVNAEIGLTFGRVLRAALRQDPDIVLVGEVRDEETMQIGLRAALTGHLVLSTLHTNDALSTINRLLDMGAQGYLLASSVRAVIGQRLVRRVCESCAEPVKLDGAASAWLEAMMAPSFESGGLLRGKGCPHCNNTGYRGRIGVYELLEVDDEAASALADNDIATFVAHASRQAHYRPIAETALNYALQGVTSLEEVQRISTDLTAPGELEGSLSPGSAAA